MDVRGGVSNYHNEALSAGNGLNTATDVGIPGANLDELHERHDADRDQQRLLEPGRRLLGVAALGSRRNHGRSVAATVTKLWGNHTIKFGGTYRHNKDFLLQTQDQGGPRGIFRFGASARPASPANTASQSQHQQRVRRVPARPAEQRRPRSRGHSEPGTKHSAVFTLHRRQVAGVAEDDAGPRPAPRVLHAARRPRRRRAGCRTTIRRPTRSASPGYGDIPDNLGVESTWRNFNPRLGLSYRLNDKHVMRAGFGVSTAPFRDNSYAFNFPVKQNNQFNAANAFVPPTGVSMAAGFPAPVVADIPSNGIIDAGADPRLRNGSYFVHPDRPEGRAISFLERRLPARAAVGASPASRLRRQLRRGHHPAPQHERRHRARHRQRRAAAVRAVRPHRDATNVVPALHDHATTRCR